MLSVAVLPVVVVGYTSYDMLIFISVVRCSYDDQVWHLSDLLCLDWSLDRESSPSEYLLIALIKLQLTSVVYVRSSNSKSTVPKLDTLR